jgi:histidinol dehydrogenase
MVTFINPPVEDWEGLTERAARDDDEAITTRVDDILQRVRTGGDRALRRVIAEIEGRDTEAHTGDDENDNLVVSVAETDVAAASIPLELRDAIDAASVNIRRFHEAQRTAGIDLETSPGVRCTQRSVPIQRVGLYVPGGTAPLVSTVLMLAIPARVAGCPQVVMCTPAGPDGAVAPAVLYAARACGIDKVFKVGGAQAIAAMAYGTETIPRVDKIFGPGNRYVTRAKQLVSVADCAVDMPAGPSEVLVMADGNASPVFVAADMLSQAEHGADSQAILVCTDEGFAVAVRREVERQLALLSRREVAAKALEESRIIVLKSRTEAIAFANRYAAEHLIIQMTDPWAVARNITAAGSIFIGPWSPESAGDYASGTNHTLPTSGWARSHSGVNLDAFVRKITCQELTRGGLESLAPTILALAEAEGLDAHAAAVTQRLLIDN